MKRYANGSIIRFISSLTPKSNVQAVANALIYPCALFAHSLLVFANYSNSSSNKIKVRIEAAKLATMFAVLLATHIQLIAKDEKLENKNKKQRLGAC